MVKQRQQRPKALEQRNLPLHHVMSDVTGVTGMRMLRAIVAGERAPQTFAPYRDSRIPSSPETLAKALEGDDRSEQLCTRPPSLALSDFPQQHIAACDQDIERVLRTCEALVDPATPPLPPPTTTPRQPQRHEPAFDLRTPLDRIAGVDLTPVPGLPAPTIQVLLAEVGLNMEQWPTEKHWAAWRGLCPDHQLSGGKGRATGSRRVQNRARRALRMAAQSLRTSPRYLGAFFRRRRRKLGPAQATTATAHTRANIIDHMLTEHTPSRERRAADYLHKDQERKRQH